MLVIRIRCRGNSASDMCKCTLKPSFLAPLTLTLGKDCRKKTGSDANNTLMQHSICRLLEPSVLDFSLYVSSFDHVAPQTDEIGIAL